MLKTPRYPYYTKKTGYWPKKHALPFDNPSTSLRTGLRMIGSEAQDERIGMFKFFCLDRVRVKLVFHPRSKQAIKCCWAGAVFELIIDIGESLVRLLKRERLGFLPIALQKRKWESKTDFFGFD